FTTRVRIIPDVFRFSNGRFFMELFDKFPIITLQNEKINEFHWRISKRLFDIAFSLFVIVCIFSWLFPLIGLLIKLDSKGPIFFFQDRWGRNNRRFKAFKFRSMIQESRDVDANGNYQQATKNDSRVTKVGAFLRKTNLDELPQFINVLLGDMSVVGPRPHPVPLNEESKKTVPRYMQRTLVNPGITGWAQVNGFRGETKKPEQMHRRIEHDLWYMENWTFYLDFEIILLTVWQMVKGDPNAF
ncbi:MAG: exopolysaccharide biosynthesis polyprenyl glycosylphosphotransferase, partial [Ignavibacteriaceae bacterium]|nr:exopolysaccharide biosynthesis polyprenyl glycosylphosphotransferase [Ignavibacteriaceae bacterium]